MIVGIYKEAAVYVHDACMYSTVHTFIYLLYHTSFSPIRKESKKRNVIAILNK